MEQRGIASTGPAFDEGGAAATEPVRFELGRRDRTAGDYVAACFDAHEQAVHGLMLATLRDSEQAADVTQEAFLRLLSEAQAGRYPDNARAWLYRTATNLAVSRIRRTTVARRLAPRLLRRDEPAGPEGIAVERERSEWMRDVLLRLSPTERIALVMAAQGESGEAIAAHIGKSHTATRTLLFRARQRLRDALEEREAAS